MRLRRENIVEVTKRTIGKKFSSPSCSILSLFLMIGFNDFLRSAHIRSELFEIRKGVIVIFVLPDPVVNFFF